MSKTKPLDLDILKEKLKRELMKEEIEKIKEKFDDTERISALHWLFTESTISQVVDITILRAKQQIKRAVQGLLQEIGELSDWSPDFQDTLISIHDVRRLTRKWFADVIKKEGE